MVGDAGARAGREPGADERVARQGRQIEVAGLGVIGERGCERHDARADAIEAVGADAAARLAGRAGGRRQALVDELPGHAFQVGPEGPVADGVDQHGVELGVEHEALRVGSTAPHPGPLLERARVGKAAVAQRVEERHRTHQATQRAVGRARDDPAQARGALLDQHDEILGGEGRGADVPVERQGRPLVVDVASAGQPLGSGAERGRDGGVGQHEVQRGGRSGAVQAVDAVVERQAQAAARRHRDAVKARGRDGAVEAAAGGGARGERHLHRVRVHERGVGRRWGIGAAADLERERAVQADRDRDDARTIVREALEHAVEPAALGQHRLGQEVRDAGVGLALGGPPADVEERGDGRAGRLVDELAGGVEAQRLVLEEHAARLHGERRAERQVGRSEEVLGVGRAAEGDDGDDGERARGHSGSPSGLTKKQPLPAPSA